jgi:hypothetical protein
MIDQNATQSLLVKVLPPTITLIFTAGFSVIVGVYLEKFKNKLILLKYTVSFSTLGTSIQDNYWGNIQVTHNGRATNYLSFVTINIINDSNNDIPKDIYLDVWVNPTSQILGVTGHYDEIGNAIFLESNYNERYNKALQILLEEKNKNIDTPNFVISSELQQEIEWVQKNKKFHLPIFNRNSSAKINLLVESSDGKTPYVSVSILQTSVKLIKKEDSEVEAKKRNIQINIYQVILNLIGLTLIFIKFPEGETAIIWTIIIGLGAYLLARLIYYSIKFIKRMFW